MTPAPTGRGDPRRRSYLRAGLVAAMVVEAAACAAGPRYAPPEPPAPVTFEAGDAWKAAEPADGAPRGQWWEIFGDARLDSLEEHLSVSNQTLKAATAAFEQARAVVGSARAGYFPQVGSGGGIIGSSQSETRPNPPKDSRFTDYLLRGDVAYEADVWGRVRGTVAASRASAEAVAADVESVGLSLHAELAIDYFQLRSLDAELQLLDSTVVALERALRLTQDRYRGGLASGIDVAQAETQLQATRSTALDLRVSRARLEHAVAALTGQTASSFSLPVLGPPLAPPQVPGGLRSTLLERRPDVAAAERRVAAADARVGVARSAFFPVLALTGTAGFESASPGSWLQALSRLWTVGPVLALTVFDGGRRRAASAQARAAHDQALAAYRQTLLTAFQEVEDNLAALRWLREEAATQAAAVAAAQQTLTLAMNRYRGGITGYLEVTAAQNAALANERQAVVIAGRRLTATVQLVKALGGTWQRPER